MATYEKVSWFQRLKNNMKDLSGREKLAYLWEYYKWFAIGAVALIIATVSVIISVKENSKEVLYSGVVANLAASEEGKAYLSEGWFEMLGGNSKKQRIELEEMPIPAVGSPVYTETSGANVTKLLAMISVGDVDYVIADQEAILYLNTQGAFTDLNSLFSEQQLTLFEGKLITAEDKDGTYPVAIDISDLPFIKTQIPVDESITVCIAFPGNTGRTERNMAFLQYLMNWSE